MKNLKKIDGKYYQECNVVMLSTDKGIIVKRNITNILKISSLDSPLLWIPQHLYIVSDEKPKIGEWSLSNLASAEPWKCDNLEYAKQYQCKKIITSTDSSLNLPQPSKQFIQKYIEEYNRGNIIGKVLVEISGFINDSDVGNYEFINKGIKIDSHNCITIKPIKDSYTREEVTTLIKRCFAGVEGKYEIIEPLQINKWIEENL